MKERLDILVANKFGLTRSKAQALIMAGNILVEGKIQTKSGYEVDKDKSITMKANFPYVSRGALKLEKAATEFNLDFIGKTICDIGASTGGFTDYALQHGATKVYAIDCGYGQLDQKLRNDKRVINMERTNIKDVGLLPEPVDIFVIDVSFISLKQVLPQVIAVIQNSKPITQNLVSVIALVKPQFEAGKAIANKYQGVIKDDAVREKVLEEIINYSKKLGYKVQGSTESPIQGAKGNREFLISLSY